jgi:hypothetical protein
MKAESTFFLLRLRGRQRRAAWGGQSSVTLC